MTSVAAPPIDQRLQGMAALIRQRIPGAEVRLFGSRARGTAGPESDIDLLITAPDAWLERRHWRSHVVGSLPGGAVAGWCSLSRKACCIDSTGRNLMPDVHSFGLDLKHAIDQISALPVLDQLQG